MATAIVALAVGAASIGTADATPARFAITARPATNAVRVAWPSAGQAAVSVTGYGDLASSGSARPAPIASMAKIMTAYLILIHHPLAPATRGFTMTITAAQVKDTALRAKLDESLVPVKVGEKLTERQALAALLLPSANNVAAILAQFDAGSIDAFVALMNFHARQLGMTHTRYTDPSGYLASTVSTAHDQLILAKAAMGNPAFANFVALKHATVPVAGLIQNTDRLLGTDGFVGIKTGSDDAAGGCFAFRSIHLVNGRKIVVTGVVMGQRNGPILSAAFLATQHLVDVIFAHKL
jgi:D-alanyl-D-alanine carboxypeptidase (penicillin-binding protein 5/6)